MSEAPSLEKPVRLSRYKGVQYRYVMTSLVTMACTVLYIIRVGLSVALVAMVNQTTLASDLLVNTSSGDECLVVNTGWNATQNTSDPASLAVTEKGEFTWSKDIQGLILSSFFFGYVVLQVPGGWLASRVSGKWTIGIGILIAGLLEFCIPSGARFGSWALIVVRSLQGLFLSLAFPAMIGLCGRWFPANEVTWLSSITQSGSCFGIIFGLSVSGLLCEYGFAGGWPSVFYVHGLIVCIWFVMWCYFVYDSPGVHPKISARERLLIMASVGVANDEERRSLRTPWCQIFRSPAVWANMVVIFAFDWNIFTLLTSLPQYMNDVIHFKITENGALSSLPYLSASLMMLLSSRAMDYIRRRGWLSTTNTRKLMAAIGLLTLPVFFIGIKFIGCDKVAAVSFICLGMACLGLGVTIERSNVLDLSPNHAGVIFGISNTVSSLSGMAAPYVVGLITKDSRQPSRGQWMYVFYTSSAISVFGAVVFLIFGSGERQAWDSAGMQRDEHESSGVVNPSFTGDIEIPQGVNMKRRFSLVGPIL